MVRQWQFSRLVFFLHSSFYQFISFLSIFFILHTHFIPLSQTMVGGRKKNLFRAFIVLYVDSCLTLLTEKFVWHNPKWLLVFGSTATRMKWKKKCLQEREKTKHELMKTRKKSLYPTEKSGVWLRHIHVNSIMKFTKICWLRRDDISYHIFVFTFLVFETKESIFMRGKVRQTVKKYWFTHFGVLWIKKIWFIDKLLQATSITLRKGGSREKNVRFFCVKFIYHCRLEAS